jgi:hypothetical protein
MSIDIEQERFTDWYEGKFVAIDRAVKRHKNPNIMAQPVNCFGQGLHNLAKPTRFGIGRDFSGDH